MPIRASVFAASACLSAALLAGCADGGSSVTRPAGTVPLSAQHSTVAGGQTAGRGAHSGTRRTLAVPTCSGTGVSAFVGGGVSNVAGGNESFVGGGQDNQACDVLSTIAGGYHNAISYTSEGGDGFIGGGEDNVLTVDDTDSAIVAGNNNAVMGNASAIVGGDGNSIVAGGSLIGAGESNTVAVDGGDGAIVSGNQNNLSGQFGFIGAGVYNKNSATYGVVAGGFTNSVSAEYGFIGAGTNNTVSGEGGYVAAGGYNTASGTGAVVDGGFNSTAAGTFATIPGGYVNSAAGTYSFAAGARASAAQTGTFVWSDGSDGDTILTSSRAYQFLARASGGVTFWTNAASTVGATLAPGSGTWASASDRNLKTDVARIDDAAVLDKVAALPIERWSYKSERGVRHVGPMAQDFYAAFRVGEDDKHITSIDEDGVALAAIKALHAQNARLTALAAKQSSQIAKLSAEVASIRAEIRAKR